LEQKKKEENKKQKRNPAKLEGSQVKGEERLGAKGLFLVVGDARKERKQSRTSREDKVGNMTCRWWVPLSKKTIDGGLDDAVSATLSKRAKMGGGQGAKIQPHPEI